MRLLLWLVAASWQKDPVVWQQQPMEAQTATSGSCLLEALSDKPNSARGVENPRPFDFYSHELL